MIAVILRRELLRAAKEDMAGLFGSSFETPRQARLLGMTAYTGEPKV